ncbi:paramyosin [Nilaparvata lugens]|uniref:paramyosin n=1 Tax=Nilaparvata lugens TaxID=108931 RepID=UPI00193E5106|nr:paramyosin [Nilaparvata lugens]
MIPGTKPAEDYQNIVVQSENLEQRQETDLGNLGGGTSDDTNVGQFLHRTEPLVVMSFLEDLDKDIDRKFSKAIQGQAPNKVQANEISKTSCSDPHGNTDYREGKMSHDIALSCDKKDPCPLSPAQSNIAKPSIQSNTRHSSCSKQVSSSKIPKPVRSQKSNIGIQQQPQPGSKLCHSNRSVPTAADRNQTAFRRQRQSSVGPGGSSVALKHPQNSPKDGKRNDNDTESHRSRIKPSQSSPIRKYEALDVILPAKKGGGETGSKPDNEESEPVFGGSQKNPESRSEFLIWLSNAISEKLLNPYKIDEYISNYKSTLAFKSDKESQGAEELELLHKLIKKVFDLYEECQSERLSNGKLQSNFELKSKSDMRKIGLLETENQNLINNMEMISRRLEEEVANNEKMKRGSQTIPSLKKRIRDFEQKLRNWEDKQREQIQKLKSLETGCKHKNMDSIEKELKEITSVCEKFSQENGFLKKELQKSEDEQRLKLVKMIDDSEEMKQIRDQLSMLRCRYNEEVNRGKKYSYELQQTSNKLKEMELSCRSLSKLVEEAKKEIKAKDKKYEELEKVAEEDKQMMRTELDACKVIKQGAVDENVMLRQKIETLHSKNEKVHSLEKESIEIEQQLRTDLALRDEQIMQLQEQIKSLLLERKNGRDVTKLKNNKMTLDQCQATYQERANLAAQIIDLQKNVDELSNTNLELQKVLADRNAELEQRDQIVKLQTDVLKIRDELIGLLRSKDSTHEKHVEELSSILMEREHAIEKELKKKVGSLQGALKDASPHETKFKELNTSDKSERKGSEKLTLKDLHLMFQNKELDLDSMQVRIRTLERNHQNFSHQRIRQETRMRILEESLQEKNSNTWIPVLVK